jgi:predicted ester cyclase
MSQIEENKEVVRKYVQAILVEQDFTQFEDHTHEGFKIDRSAVPEAIVGSAGLSKQMEMLYKAFPDLKITIADIVAEGDKVVVRFEAPGKHTGHFAGIDATGKDVVWKGLVMYRVHSGKVAEAWANWDDYGLIVQLQEKNG